ncbi:hypothetical protein AB0J42_01320 [Nonomuraea sp. NPDC049649]|uniref:hypothetical protein n=1 Tax=Nonomuraea sp. NPDC049649 TaxID=3155776 RepID=UPI00343EC2D6
MFLLGSLGAGLAPGPVALIAARAVQAAGAALFYPQVLAVLQTVFTGRARAFAAFGTTIGLAFFAGNAGLFFVLTLHLQDGLGYSPLTAGLAFVPLAAAFTAASLLGARLQARLGRHTLTLGYGINAAARWPCSPRSWRPTARPGGRCSPPWPSSGSARGSGSARSSGPC